MSAYVTGQREAQEVIGVLFDTLDHTPDIADRARLAALVRDQVNRELDLRLYRLCHDLHRDGWTHLQIAEHVGLSRQTVNDWIHRWRVHSGLPRTDRAERDRMFARAIELKHGWKG